MAVDPERDKPSPSERPTEKDRAISDALKRAHQIHSTGETHSVVLGSSTFESFPSVRRRRPLRRPPDTIVFFRTLSITIPLAGLLITSQLRNNPVAIAIVAILAISATGFCYWVGLVMHRRDVTRMMEKRGEVRQSSRDLSGLPAEASDVSPSVTSAQLNEQKLAEYQEISRQQAKSAFRASQIAMAVGFAFLVGGGAVALRSAGDTAGQIIVGALASLGGALSAYIGATFTKHYNQTVSQMNYYYAQPLVQSYILKAEELAGRVSDRRKDGALEQIIKVVLDGATVASSLIESESDGHLAHQRDHKSNRQKGRPRLSRAKAQSPSSSSNGSIDRLNSSSDISMSPDDR